DGERMLVQLDRAADHAAIILKMAVPIRVGKHDIRSAVWAALVGCVNETAKIRLNAQCVEVIPGHFEEPCAGWIVAGIEAYRSDVISRQILKAAVAIAQIE